MSSVSIPAEVTKSISASRKAIEGGSLSLTSLVQHFIGQIELHNPKVNAFVAVYGNEALAEAERIEQKIKAGTAGKLAGAVIGIKDVLAYQNHGLQSGSKILDNFVSQFTGTAVQRLIDADAIIIGRQNCDEFAMGSASKNPWFGAVKNFANPEKVAGGSSGGSAAAVQAGMCHASIGSDTGGSVRQPAAFTGTVGLKPTYSRISRWGLVAYASSFDCIGPIAHNVEDSALLLEVMAGADTHDSTCSSKPVDTYSKAELSGKLKIAVLKQSFSEGVQPEIKNALNTKIEHWKSLGYTVEEVDFSLLDYLLNIYYIITTAEASSNLSRFDGVRYGYRSEKATDLESLYKLSRSEGFGPEVKRRIMLGTFVLSASYYDAYFTKAQKVRRLVKEQTEELLSKYNFLVCPTTPTVAFGINEKVDNPIEMYLNDIFTVQANVCGIPAISIPLGENADKLPFGLQIMAGAFQESKLLAFAKQNEISTLA
jgi:aspartyl-tRNA(Asn)/glutamyl-tRNA(Gln) amidotransferase subunit A